MSCKIYIVRHGETDWNKVRRIQGHTDIPLNSEGESQALMLGNKFESINFSAIYSSDLSRAKRTAELIVNAKRLPVTTSELLRERFWGIIEGENIDELNQLYGDHMKNFLTMLDPPKELLRPELATIETYKQTNERVMSYLSKLSEQHVEEEILVVSHSGVLKGLLMQLGGIHYGRCLIQNAGYLKLEFVNGAFELRHTEGIGVHKN